MKKSFFSPSLILLFISLSLIILIAKDYRNFKIPNQIHVNQIKSPSLNLKNLIANNLANKKGMAQDLATDKNTLPSLLNKEKIYSEQDINEMTEDNFIDLLKKIEHRLPKLIDIKKLFANELHHTPSLLVNAGRDLGVIKEILKIHESYEREAIPFYKNCAKNEEGVTSVRALCLTNLIEIKTKNNEPFNLKDYPEKLVELTKMINDI